MNIEELNEVASPTSAAHAPNDPLNASQLNEVPSSDYCEYFFLRNLDRLGHVITCDPKLSTVLLGASMLAHNRGNQLFKFQAISGNLECVQIIHQATQKALHWDGNGYLVLVAPDGSDKNQQWALSATNQLNPGGNTEGAVALIQQPDGTSILKMQNSDNSTAQQFEVFYPSNFVYLRNSWTGRVITTDTSNNVSWQPINFAQSENQQWGITPEGYLVNRLTAQVLQLSQTAPIKGIQLNTSSQQTTSPDNSYQKFDVLSNGDGTFRSDGGFALAIGPDNSVITADYSANDYTQLIEPLSPYQFFSLKNGVTVSDYHEWLARSGNTCVVGRQADEITQYFTISRYGEIISSMDGYVLQSQGLEAVPSFVDPEPDPIGFDTTTFQYLPSGTNPNYGAIALRSDSNKGLIDRGGRPAQPVIHNLTMPVSGNQAWQLVGPPNSLFSTNQDIAIAFFSNPAPLPGTPSDMSLTADPEIKALINDTPKATQIIFALVAGILDIVAGITPTSATHSVVTRVASVVYGNTELTAKIAVFMQGTVTVAYIVDFAQEITKQKLWWKLCEPFIPHSFWGWAITTAKITLSITAWTVPGLGPAVTGAKIALLCADILRILNGDFTEGTLIQAHLDRRLSSGPQVSEYSLEPLAIS